MTKNITLAVPEDLLAQYRILAAEQSTTVNALVRKHMEEATGTARKRKDAIARMIELGQASARDSAEIKEAGGKIEKWRWSREETYAEREWPKKQ
ncbi:MAG: hypothetical protein C0515_11700 [Novosphingobium sp.]|nr:hypothetical protein [Novosphingobium sp.]MBS3931327.1 hypothetical protein [Sphingomonadales bacterium]